MKKLFSIGVVALTLAFASCTTFTPVSAGNGEVGARKGTATACVIQPLPLFPINIGNNTMLHAAKSGSISHIATVDSKNTTLFGGFIVIKTTIVTGD